MKKFDVNSIVSEVQNLYSKDPKSKKMISTGDTVRQTYTDVDGIPIPDQHPLRLLSGLPCLPYGKIVQISGKPDVGKSTFCGQVMAAAQHSDHLVVLLDSELKYDAARYDTHFKGSSKDLVLIQSNEILHGAEKVRKVITAAKDKYKDIKILFVWDSVGGSQSRSHAEKELDDEKGATLASDARENASVMRMLVGLFNKYPDSIAVLLANQVYSKIGFMQTGEAESGGKKIEFHSSLIIQLKRVKTLTKIVKGVKMKYGIISRAVTVKNHLNQGDTSIHQLDFEITAAGAHLTDAASSEDDE